MTAPKRRSSKLNAEFTRENFENCDKAFDFCDFYVPWRICMFIATEPKKKLVEGFSGFQNQ